MNNALPPTLLVLALAGFLGAQTPQADPSPAPQAPQAEAPKAPAGPDHGLLDPAWFGTPGPTFRQGKHITYYWVKPGLDLDGKAIQQGPWAPVAMLRADATKEDREKAEALNAKLPEDLAKGSGHRRRHGVRISPDGGDYILTGRVVDYHSGSMATKIGTAASLATGKFAGAIVEKVVRKEEDIPEDQGKECVTFDLKIEDARTHELVLAIHQKSFDPFSAELSFEKWSRHLAKLLSDGED
jgi:hypothetical protein